MTQAGVTFSAKPEVDRLSDVDVAVELARKEPDLERAHEQDRQRAEGLAYLGRRFRNVLEWEGCGNRPWNL